MMKAWCILDVSLIHKDPWAKPKGEALMVGCGDGWGREKWWKKIEIAGLE